MSLNGSYDDNNLFAKILRGEVPAVKVYDDDAVLAFMDIFPQARGHLLVVPKGVKARNFLELPADKVAPLMERVHKLTIAAEKALKPDGITVTQFNGEDAGGALESELAQAVGVKGYHRQTFLDGPYPVS
jgi:histidine triad (HIT) family protein